jgi:hypothetical protein
MTITTYVASVQVFTSQLKAMAGLLAKLDEHCAAEKIDPLVLLNARLAPDMFPFIRQVQIACDFAKGAAARLSGQEPKAFPDTEITVEDLRQRVQRTHDYVTSFPQEAVNSGAAREITFRTGPDSTMTLPGGENLTKFALPNFYFHMTTAYAILRNHGVALGKRDFLGA